MEKAVEDTLRVFVKYMAAIVYPKDKQKFSEGSLEVFVSSATAQSLQIELCKSRVALPRNRFFRKLLLNRIRFRKRETYTPQVTDFRNLFLVVIPEKILPPGDYLIRLRENKKIRSRIFISVETDYLDWGTRFRRRLIERRRASADGQSDRNDAATPLFSIITAVYNTDPYCLKALKESIQSQTEQKFEWLILDNGSTQAECIDATKRMSESDSKIRYWRHERGLGITGGYRFLLQNARGDYIVPVDHDDLLFPDSLAIMSEWIFREQKPEILFSDEIFVTPNGRPGPVIWRPDYSRVHSLATIPGSHLMVFKRSIALESGVYSGEYAEGSVDWDAILRMTDDSSNRVRHIPEVLYGWRIVSQSTAANPGEKGYISKSQIQNVQNALKRRKLDERFEVEPLLPGKIAYFHLTRKHSCPLIAQVDFVLQETQDIKEAHRNILQNIRVTRYPGVRFRLICPERHRGSFLNIEDLDVQSYGKDMLPFLNEVSDGKYEVKAIIDLRLRLLNESWLWEATGPLELDQQNLVVGGLILSSKQTVFHCGYVGGLEGFFDTPWYDQPVKGKIEIAMQKNVLGMYGGFLVFRSRGLQTSEGLRGMDEDDGLFGLELCLRWRKMGGLAVFAPRMTAIRSQPLMFPLGKSNPGLKKELQINYANFIKNDPYYFRELSRESSRYGQPG